MSANQKTTHGADVEDRLRLNAPHSVDGALMTEAANEIQRLQDLCEQARQLSVWRD